MAVTSITLTNLVSGYTVPIWPALGVSAKSLEVEPAIRAVTEDRVGAHGSFDTTAYLSEAPVTLNLILYGTAQGAFVDSIGPLLQPSVRPALIVTDDEWASARQLIVRLDSMSKARSDRTNWPVQIIWWAVNGVWEASSQTVLNVPVTLPSTAGIDFKPQGAAFSYTATSASPCVFTATASNYPAGTQVIITGSVPTGFTAGQAYFVVAPTANTFELAASAGGAALGSSSTGSGTVFDRGGIHFTSASGLDMPATTSPGEFQVTNPGTAASQWTAQLYGPATGPKIANDTAGLTIEFTDSIVLQPGEFIALDSRARTALRNGNVNASVLGALNFGTTDWWTLQPGVNQLRYYPTSGSAGAEAVISFSPAWMT